MIQIAWSWSRLNDFESCPQKFFHKYILKDCYKEEYVPHLEKGKFYHLGMELMLRDGFDSAMQGLVADTRDKQQWLPDVQRVMVSLKPMVEAMRKAPIYEAEKQIAYDIRMNKVSWFSKQAWCRVIYDAVAVWPGEKAFVLDWKTGKFKPQVTGQLKLFGGSALVEYDVPVVDTAYVWLEHKKTTPAVYRRPDRDPIWNEFGDRSNLIQLAVQSGNWPCKPSPLCNWCPVGPDQCQHKKA